MNENEHVISPLYLTLRCARNEAAKRFIERSKRLGYKGKLRNAFAIEFMIGAVGAIVADYPAVQGFLASTTHHLTFEYSAYAAVKRWANEDV